MKRLLLLALPVAFGIALMLPVTLITIQNNVIQVKPNVAQAEIKYDDCVKTAFKITKNAGSCVDNKAEGGALVVYVKQILVVMSGLIGGIIVLMIVIAGFQYIVSRGDPASIKKAKDRIQNAIIALVLFMSSLAILNYLLPGGLT